MITTFQFDANLPKRDRKHLTQVRHTKQQVELWLQRLSATNPFECGKELYQILTELVTLDIEAELRLELVTLLQPNIHHLIVALEKFYLQQPLLLSIQGRRTLALAQTLRQNLALNYKIIAVEVTEKLKGKMGFLDFGRKAGQNVAATAIQQYILQAQRILLDNYRQYEVATFNLWYDIHNLARLAELHGLLDHPPLKIGYQSANYTIKQAYLATILFHASRVNKLRASELELIYQYSLDWSQYLTISNTSADSLLVCNRDDNPPLYHHRAVTAYDSWYIQAHHFVDYLRQDLSQTPIKLPAHLQRHLLTTWAAAKERMFVRRPVNKAILLSVGMSAAHYYISGQIPFKTVAQGEEKTQEIEQPKFLFGLEEDKVPEEPIDAWQICYGAVASIDDEQKELPKVPTMTYMPYRVKAVNRSPGGLKLVWTEPPPSSLRVGEVIAISEERDQGWGVGVLHWIQQKSDKTIEIGIELLAAQPNACGVCLLKNNKPASDYMRGFLIPEMPSVEQPATLMTLNAGLTVGSVVRVSQHGETVDMHLTKLVLSTQSLSQFEFEPVHKTDDGFDPMASLWRKLNV